VRFIETELSGAFIIELEPSTDERGFFARSYCAREFEVHGLNMPVAQCNISFNIHKGTLRGLHYQAEPAAERKLVRCTRGAIHDVIVDVRPESPTYLDHFALKLSADNRTALFVPERFAHGFQTLVDDTEVFYQMSKLYSTEHGRGLRYDDPALAIRWPLAVTQVSDRDLRWPPLPQSAFPSGR
jgi:dTDP-4-dehydrorhamnose 3,5-epimerase